MTQEFVLGTLPPRLSEREDLDMLLKHAVSHDASDMFLLSGQPVKIQRHSSMLNISSPNRPITEPEILSILKSFYGVNAQAKLGAGEPIDTSYEFYDREAKERFRFRVNASACLRNGRQGYTVTFRSIPTTPPKPKDIPEAILETCHKTDQGLILIVGATGNGKSTLLASVLRDILEQPEANKNLITLEAPIEFVYDEIDMPTSFVTQMEVGRHIANFADGVRNTLRMAPKIILVGESRDYETISASVEASVTGHTVLSTVHANSVSETIMRMVAAYPTDLQSQALSDILTATKMVVAQRLLPSTDGARVAVREYLVFDHEAKERIRESNNLVETVNRIVSEKGVSMFTSATELHAQGRISESELNKVKLNYE